MPLTVWLTGLPGAGKSTLAAALGRELVERGYPSYVLDSDRIRHGLNRDLGFSRDDRSENARRLAEAARLFNDAGLIAIVACIAPYAEDRRVAGTIVGPERFLEVYLTADVATCERRDPQGLYAKARAGGLAHFTGVSAPYEVPTRPGLTLDTASRTVDACTRQMLDVLLSRFAGRLRSHLSA